MTLELHQGDGDVAASRELSSTAEREIRLSPPDDLSPELRQVIADIRAHSSSDSDAVRRALKFVQTEVRYTGVEIGQGSFRPTHPNRVLERRYGDCKDKALLLSAILRALGYKAQPALVSPFLGRDVAQVLPMTRVFNHMLVMTEVDGKTYWLDATRTFQEGTLDRIGNPRLRWALVTGNSSEALTAMADGQEYRQELGARYEVTIKDYREPVSVNMITTYSGVVAEMLRAELVAGDRRQLTEEFLAEMRRWYPGASSAGDAVVSDDADRNIVTVTQRFTVRDFFEERSGVGVGRLYAIWIRAFAEAPAKLERSAPLALAYPFTLNISYVVDFPNDIKLRGSPPVSLSDDNLDFTILSRYENNRLQVDYRLTTHRDTVPTNDVKTYADMLRAVRDRIAYQFPVQKVQLVTALVQQPAGLKAPAFSQDSAKEVVAALDREQEGRVRALSESIESGRVRGEQLADMLESRAIAYSNLDRTEPALADLARAIALDPKAASPLVTRGEVYTKRGEYMRALADFARASALEPGHQRLAVSRGHASFLAGDYRSAQSDFRRVVERASDEEQLYALIWLYLASQRLGQDGRGIIAAVRSRADLARWPGPAVMLFIGESTPEQMLAAAWSFDSQNRAAAALRGLFFPWPLLSAGRRSRARPHRLQGISWNRGEDLLGV